jgi:hypothetical protein
MWRFKRADGHSAIFEDGGDRLRVEARHEGCLRVTATRNKDFLLKDEPMIVSRPEGALRVAQAEGGWLLTSGLLSARLDAKTGALSYSRKEKNSTGNWKRAGARCEILHHQIRYSPLRRFRKRRGVVGRGSAPGRAVCGPHRLPNAAETRLRGGRSAVRPRQTRRGF